MDSRERERLVAEATEHWNKLPAHLKFGDTALYYKLMLDELKRQLEVSAKLSNLSTSNVTTGSMAFNVLKYRQDKHDLICLTDSGKKVNVDPFVTGAISVTEDNYKQIGLSLIGKRFKTEENPYLSEANTYLPDLFIESPLE